MKNMKSTKINLITVFVAFNDMATAGNYPASVRALGNALIYQWNKKCWREDVTFSDRMLMELSGIPKSSIGRARSFLQDVGWLTADSSKGRTSYRLIFLGSKQWGTTRAAMGHEWGNTFDKPRHDAADFSDSAFINKTEEYKSICDEKPGTYEKWLEGLDPDERAPFDEAEPFVRAKLKKAYEERHAEMTDPLRYLLKVAQRLKAAAGRQAKKAKRVKAYDLPQTWEREEQCLADLAKAPHSDQTAQPLDAQALVKEEQSAAQSLPETPDDLQRLQNILDAQEQRAAAEAQADAARFLQSHPDLELTAHKERSVTDNPAAPERSNIKEEFSHDESIAAAQTALGEPGVVGAEESRAGRGSRQEDRGTPREVRADVRDESRPDDPGVSGNDGAARSSVLPPSMFSWAAQFAAVFSRPVAQSGADANPVDGRHDNLQNVSPDAPRPADSGCHGLRSAASLSAEVVEGLSDDEPQQSRYQPNQSIRLKNGLRAVLAATPRRDGSFLAKVFDDAADLVDVTDTLRLDSGAPSLNGVVYTLAD